ncbi:CU044_5270 family protein [Actinomadura roseirufa]|uniref:CU044_5270 family protein n=1 Tax=Actinomadura roseirufa TaxID=2094049 RepID=UPI0010414794|nr:CU044_5270 family protein [Actinomadura roseirufa]
MKTSPNQPDPDEFAELARLLPGPVERDLPSGRHRQIQEFVMSQIHQDLQSADQAPRRSPKRRPILLGSALAAVAAVTAAAVVIGGSGSGEPAGSKNGSGTQAAASPSGRQLLLVAATTAERAPKASGTYWYVKTTRTNSNGGGRTSLESWTRRDGRVWWKGEKTGGKAVQLTHPIPFRLGGPDVTFEQLQKLPTTPDALKTWIAKSVESGNIRTSAGKLDAAGRKESTFEGLLSLVSQLPAPPKVRAAAFRAIASYPNVKNLGRVKGGQGLSIAFRGNQSAHLVVDPKTSRIIDTDYFVSADGGVVSVPGGASITAEWTNLPPK